MASTYTTIDASGMESIDYATYLTDYFAAMGTTTRGATTYYDSTYYASVAGYYTAGQVGVRYASSTNNAQVLMEGDAMQYDGVDGVNHGSYSGSVDKVSFGFWDADTTFSQINGVARSTIIGVIKELTVSGLDISEEVGAGGTFGTGNDFYDLMTLLRDGNSTTIATGETLSNGELAIQKLYAMFAAKAQYFIGSEGDDTYVGTKFADRIDGNAGSDTLSGGAGRDTFVFNLEDSSADVETADMILDFNAKKDRLDFSGIDTNENKDGDQAFKYLGNAEFTGKAGQIIWDRAGGDTFVHLDLDGDSVADMTIALDGKIKLTVDSFIL